MNIRAAFLRTSFWVRDYFNGSPIRTHYNDLRRFSRLGYEGYEQIRQRKLKRILEYAVANCPFYAKVGKHIKLTDFPIVNKSILIENYDAIVVPANKIPGQIGKVHIQSTSGSTGTPFKVPQDTNKRMRRIAELKFFGKEVGFRSHEMLIHLRTWNHWQSKTPRQIRRENIIPYDISKMGEGELGVLCTLINQHKAVCLRAYASSFDLLAKYVTEHPTEFPSLKILIAGSEALQDDVRANVKKSLKCEIISQYANEECGIIAQERIPTKESDNPMYINHASYILEILKMDSDQPASYGELGRVVLTDLHNYAFPIIRYDTGDVGILLPPDAYSRGYPVLGKLYGRRFDVCYTADNEPFFPMTIGRVLKHYDQIKQWQFIQKGQKEYLLKVMMNNGINTDSYLAPAIVTLVETLGKDADVKIEQVDGIPTLASGKRKPVVNEWKQQLKS